MPNHSHHTPHQHRVTALFGDHEQSFDLTRGTTLAQLVERLADLARQNHGWPVGISVLFDTTAEPAGNGGARQPQSAAWPGQSR